MEKIQEFGKVLTMPGTKLSEFNLDQEINSFQANNELIIPQDLVEYFHILNWYSNAYDHSIFFEFYSITKFKTVKEVLGDYGGIPDYRNIVNTLHLHEYCYVFADYSLSVLTYAIRLYKEKSLTNEIYVICGDKYEVIANSFTEFIDHYLKNDEIIYL